MTAKQWSAWLAAAGLTAVISIISTLQSSEIISQEAPELHLANMTKAQKDSVAREELYRAENGDEILSLRKRNAKIFKEKNGRFSSVIYTKSKHYMDDSDSVFKEIDLTVHSVANAAKTNPGRKFDKYVNAGLYKATWFDEKPWDYTIYKDDYYITYTALFDTSSHIGIITEQTATGVKQSIILNDNSSPSAISWNLDTNAAVYEEDGGYVFRDDSGSFLFAVQKAIAWDSTGRYITVQSALENNVLTYSLIVPEDAEYPITIDPSTNTVIDDHDAYSGTFQQQGEATYSDARNATSSFNSGDYMHVGQWKASASDYHVYRNVIRFDTSFLPYHAEVTAAEFKGVLSIDYSTADFNIRLVTAQDSLAVTALNTSQYNEFEGWAASGAYGVNYVSDTSISTSGKSVGDTLTWTFNSTGENEINISGYTQFFMLSENDISETAPTTKEEVFLEDDTIYLRVWYDYEYINPPTNFRLDNAADTSIRAQYTIHHSENVDSVAVVNASDNAHIKYFDSVTDTVMTVTGLTPNAEYSWKAMVDSLGTKVYSDSASLYTILNPPGINDITIVPISSDTLRISVMVPPNSTSGQTGMQVEAVSGDGATSSGWLSGVYSYLDGGLNPDSTYVYKVRYRNGDGIATYYSPDVTYAMNGVESTVLYLSGDTFDDYNVDFGNGRRDSTEVKAGASDAGERLDGFVSFTVPWQVVNGGIDSLFLTMNRTDEKNETTPTITVYGLPVKLGGAIESRALGSEDSTAASADWAVDTGTGEKKSPDLRDIFNEWRDISSVKNYNYSFGLRLDDNSQAAGDRAVFIDSSHPSYSNDTKLTIYYTPGYYDSLEAAPGNFSMNVLAPDTVRVTWTDNSESEYGFVILNSADSTLASGTDSLAQNTTSLDVGGLVPNTLYDWFVMAYTAEDDSSSANSSARTSARIPGATTVVSLTSSMLKFIISPQDNPAYTEFAVEDSITGYYVDGSAEPDTLKAGPLGEWGWNTYALWGNSNGDTLTGLAPDSLYVLRAKARSGE